MWGGRVPASLCLPACLPVLACLPAFASLPLLPCLRLPACLRAIMTPSVASATATASFSSSTTLAARDDASHHTENTAATSTTTTTITHTLSFDDAMRIPALRSVHDYASAVWNGDFDVVSLDTMPLKFGSPLRDLESTYIEATIPKHIKLMRWLSVIAGDGFGRATSKPLVVGIDADCVDYVYESMDLERYLLDPDSSLQGYCTHDSSELCTFHAISLDARQAQPPDARLQISREHPARKAIDLHVHFLWRWAAPSGGVFALVCSTALDVTDTYFARADAKRKAFERDVCDHRYGNYIRESQLLLEAGLYDRLHCSLEFLADEIDIRRDKPVNNKAVDLALLFEPCVQSLKYDRTTLPRERFWFKSTAGNIVPYKAIQVKILLDVCSNAVKHGDGFITIVRSPTTIRVANNVAIKRSSSKRSSSFTGLRALKAECEALGLAINFRNENAVFEAVISVVTEEEACEIKDSSGVAVPRELARRAPPDNRTAPWRAQDLAWIIIDDQSLICTLWSKHMLRHHGVMLKTLSSPAEVANAAAVLWETVADARLVVCIMDEHLFKLTASFETRPCTGTELRDEFDQKPKLRDAIRHAKIHFVGASSTELADPRLHSVIGKYGTTSRMIKTILNDIALRGLHSRH